MFKTLIRTLALFMALQPALVAAQTYQTVPDRTVIGRIGVGGSSGPSQPIPFATLTGALGAVPVTRTISTTAPLAGGGDLSANRTLSITGAAGQVLAGSGPAFTATPVLGVAGTTVGALGFQNATSGTQTIQPATGALASGIATLPAGTYGFVGDSLTQTLTNKTFNCANQTSCIIRIASDVTGLGTGVATALGINVGSAGAFVTFNGAGGTPSSITLTNGTGLPVATGIANLGTGVATALGVNVATAGSVVVNGGVLGTPSSGTVTNLTGTASININGTVGATTPSTGAFTTLTASASIALTNSQNAATSANVTNTNTSTAALASHGATNSNGAVGFGVGGSGYTGIALLQNRGYIDAASALSGIVINNEGANPILFGISSAEVGRWDSATPGKMILGVAGATVGQSCFGNATSGTECIQPATGALGSGVATLPAGTYNIVGDTLTQTLTNKSIVATQLTGTVQAAQMPAFTGDCTTSAGAVATTCTKINGVDQTTAWSTYTPTITGSGGSCGACTITATGRSKTLGKTVFAEVDITITAIGSWTGALNATLPTNSAGFRYAGSCFEYSTTGKSGAGYINGGAAPTLFQSRDAAAGSWFVNGYGLACTIVYEIP